MEKITVEIIKGVEGLAILINDYRVCGPKPWGGGKVIKQWVVNKSDLLEAIEQK